jgi:NitT/TauT family transport system permease protein
MSAAVLDPTTGQPTPPRRSRRGRFLSGAVWLRVAAALTVLAAWWLISQTVAAGVFPSPLQTWDRFLVIVSSPDFFSQVGITLWRVVSSMAVAVSAAVVIGIAMGRIRRVEMSLDMFVLVGRSIPGLVWALVAVMVVGLNNWAPVLAVFLTVTPLVVMQIWEQSKAIDDDLFRMAKAFGVGSLGRIRQVLLPALVPSIVAGAKLGLALGWQIVVLSELFGLGSGVGYQINESFGNFDVAGVLVWTIVFSVIMAFLEYGVIDGVHHRLVRWRPVGR